MRQELTSFSSSVLHYYKLNISLDTANRMVNTTHYFRAKIGVRMVGPGFLLLPLLLLDSALASVYFDQESTNTAFYKPVYRPETSFKAETAYKEEKSFSNYANRAKPFAKLSDPTYLPSYTKPTYEPDTPFLHPSYKPEPPYSKPSHNLNQSNSKPPYTPETSNYKPNYAPTPSYHEPGYKPKPSYSKPTSYHEPPYKPDPSYSNPTSYHEPPYKPEPSYTPSPKCRRVVETSQVNVPKYTSRVFEYTRTAHKYTRTVHKYTSRVFEYTRTVHKYTSIVNQ